MLTTSERAHNCSWVALAALSPCRGAGLVAQALAVHTGQVVHEAVKTDLLHDATHHLVVVELGSGGDLLNPDGPKNLGFWLTPSRQGSENKSSTQQLCSGRVRTDENGVDWE